jgi:hypothetical protein
VGSSSPISVAVFLDQKLQEEGSSPGTQGTTGHTAASKILGVTPHPSPPPTHTHKAKHWWKEENKGGRGKGKG